MNHKILIPLAAIATGIFLLILFYLIRCLFHRSKNPQQKQQQSIQRASSLQNGISKLQQRETIFNNKRRSSYYVLRRGISSKPLFNWSDNPSLITDAVENGWSRFAFSNYVSSSSTKSILSYCGSTGDGKDKEIVETSWEVCEGSSDFMQTVRLNSGSKKSTNSSLAACSVIKSSLPLPGPVVANSFPFPQEAYFEITILSTYENEFESDTDKGDSEKVKLIHAGEKVSSESLVHLTSNNNNSNSNNNNNINGMNIKGVVVNAEELKSRNSGKDVAEGKMEISVVFSVGLVGGGSLPLKLPGSYPGSIGFNSDGSVYLEGIKLKTELEYEEWGKADKVIGCGYNPNQKKVYFTVDGKLVREIYCTTEEFETPLYPILAANGSLTVLVNFGQSVFKYTQANLHRTPNPCFVGQSANSPIIGYEDSRELFSMGRIDAHWLDRSTKRNAQYFGSVNRGMSDYDESSDGDLFEIVLDNNSRGRSPSMHY